MAAVARTQPGGGSSGIKVALVVFVVLTVASLSGTIILYTYQADKVQTAADSLEQAKRAEQKTRDMQNQLKEFARNVIGEDTDELPKIKQALAATVQRIADDPNLKQANIAADSALVTAFDGLYQQFSTQAQSMANAMSKTKELQGKLDQIEEAASATRKEFTDKTDELQKKYQEIEQQSAQNHQAWDQQVAALTAQLETASQSATQQLGVERDQRQKVEQKLAESQRRVQELITTLASFRPRSDPTSALQIADGQVVRAVAGQDVVYISLGRKDGMKTGMTFAVYSRTRGIPENGKGKATLEVKEIFETTAECKVTASTPGDPILEDDVIANPVFDRSRKYNFVVAGDFDLNFDNQVEDVGGEQVKTLIRQAGGNIVDSVDTRTDFVVLGGPPPVATAAEKTDTPEAQELANQRAGRRKGFDTTVNEAKSLSIPILTRTQFLSFFGLTVPKNTPDDQRTW